MHGVETFRLALRQVQHACGDDRKACLLEPAIDLADEIASHAVGLDDGQGALERHSLRPFRKLLWVRVFAPACNAGARASREVYLGSRTRGNLACDGSAGLVRLFGARKPKRSASQRSLTVRRARKPSDGEALPAAAFALDVRVS